jgi:hypothetical protein
MTEITTAATKTKTAKYVASSTDIPDYGISKFAMPKFDHDQDRRVQGTQ